jgi:hypothetical protein
MNDQPLEDVAKDVGYEALWAAAGEGVFRTVLRPLGRKIMAPFQKRVDDETRAALSDAQDLGLRTTPSNVNQQPLMGRFENIASQIFGDVVGEHNAKRIAALSEDLVKNTGPRVTYFDVGESVAKSIRGQRKQFQQRTNQLFERVGSDASIQTNQLKATADEIRDEMLPDWESPETVAFLKKVADLPDDMSPKDLMKVRRALSDALHDDEILPGVNNRYIGQVIGSIRNTLMMRRRVAISRHRRYFEQTRRFRMKSRCLTGRLFGRY